MCNQIGTLNHSTKDEKNCRIIVWNVQLALKQDVKVDLLMEELMRIKPDILLIQEPGPAGSSSREIIQDAMRLAYDKVKIVQSYNVIEKSSWQYGGVLSVVADNWVNMVHSVLQDPKLAGRFNLIRIRGKQGRLYSILNIYKPHWNVEGGGVAAVQRTLINARYPSQYTTKQIWTMDFFHIIDEELRNGNEVIVAGDFNMVSTEDDDIFNGMRVRGLVNVLEKMYGPLPSTRIQPEIYTQIKGAIDHIYATSGIYVKEGCIGPFTILSDHAFLVIDLFAESMFHKRFVESTPELRAVHSKKPHTIKHYRSKLDEKIDENKIIEDLHGINRRVLNQQTIEGDEEKYSNCVERLDELTIGASGKAPRRKYKSQSLHMNRAILIWRQIIGWCKNQTQSRGLMKWKLRSIGEREDILKTITVEEAQKRLTESWNAYYEKNVNKRNNKQKRQNYMAKGYHELNQEKSITTYEKEIEQREKSKNEHMKIRIARGKLKGAGIYMLEKDVDGEKVQILDKEQIEKEAIAECWNKVHASDITVLRKEPLHTILKVGGTIEEWEEHITNGGVTIPDSVWTSLNRGTRLFLEKVFQNKAEDMKIDISPEGYYIGWKQQKENTSSAPGVNFSHMMCVEEKSLANQARALASNIRLNTGWNPKPYLKAMDSLLMKKAGVHTVKGMRLITLQHCACNHDHKMIGKWINEQGEKHNLFAVEQAGCRNGMSSREQALNKVLMLDISRLQHKPMAVIANDAKGCFDRIVLMPLFLALRRMGIPFPALKAMITAIFDMKHTVKTVYGESTVTYGGDGNRPNGLMQGNGMAGQGFSALSSVLLDICREQGYGFQCKSPISGISKTFVGTMFVDDLDAMNTKHEHESDAEFLQRTQEFITLWSQLLAATGGALEPTKTDWCNFSYKKVAGKWKLQQQDGDLFIQDELTNDNIKLQKLPLDEPRRTLGIRSAITGSQKGQIQHLLQVIDDFRLKMQGSFLDRNAKLLAMQTTVTRTIEHGSTATTFTRAQSNLITKKLRQGVLNGLGYANTMPLEVVHGPRELNGIEVMDYEICQGAEQIRVMLDHWNRESMTGQLLRTESEEYDLLVGTNKGFWNTDEETVLGILPESWMSSLKDFMARYNIQMQVQKKPLVLWRTHDKFLMDMVLRCEGWSFTKEELIGFNEVRMTLRVNTISDILVNDTINERVWKALGNSQSLSSRHYTWPGSGKLTKTEIQSWQSVLMKIGFAPGNRYAHTMGNWSEDARPYLAICSGDKAKVWVIIDDVKRQYGKILNKRGQWYANEGVVDEIPNEHETGYATYYMEDDKIQILEIVKIEKQGQSMDRTCDWISPTIEGQDALDPTFAEKLRNGTGVLIADASDNKRGVVTAAFVEALPIIEENIDELRGAVQVPCATGRTSSYRGELGGVVAAVTYVNKVAESHAIDKGQCTIMCDNKSVMKRATQATDPNFVVSARFESFDLLRVLQKRMRSSRIKFVFLWLKGHQDEQNDYDDLTDEARANVRADGLAKRMTDEVTPLHSAERLPDEDICFSINGERLHGSIYATLWDAKHREPLIAYWECKGRFVNKDGIDWESVGAANRKLDLNTRRNITKLLSGWCATADKMYQRGQYTDSECPLCRQTTEDRRHIFRCQDPRMKSKIFELMHTMESRLQHQPFQPGIFPVVEALFDMYQFDSETYIQTLDEDQITLVNEQRSLGANSFMEGILHNEWRLWCGGMSGSIRLIRMIYDMWIQLWKHRNDLVKGAEKDWKRTQARRDEIITLHMDCPVNISIEDKGHYAADPDQICTWTTEKQCAWIVGAKAIIEKYKKLRSSGLRRFLVQRTNDQAALQRAGYQRRMRLRTQLLNSQIAEMRKWTRQGLNQRDTRLLNQGTTIMEKSTTVQRWWLKQAQEIRRRFENNWHARNNLKEWIIHEDDGRKNPKIKDTDNGNIGQKKQQRSQMKITKWLVKNADDEG